MDSQYGETTFEHSNSDGACLPNVATNSMYADATNNITLHAKSRTTSFLDSIILERDSSRFELVKSSSSLSSDFRRSYSQASADMFRPIMTFIPMSLGI